MKLLTQIQSSAQITALNYGPYDNGYLLLGLANGCLMGFDVNSNFDLVFQIQLCNFPLTGITFDPTHLVLVSCEATKHIYAVSLIEKKFEYVYLDLGVNQYCTVQLDHQKHKESLLKNARSKRLLQ
jgi:hypothetical protein